MIDTLQGMAINADTERVRLANTCGSLSGPAIKAVTLAMVYRVYAAVARNVGVPSIGMGGMATWRDAVEFLLAGATAVAVGTCRYVDPTIVLTLCDGLAAYLRDRKLTSPSQLIGLAHAGQA